MMYAGAPGYDNVAGLVVFDPQPQCPGISYPLRRHVGNGLMLVDGAPTATVTFNVLRVDQYLAILSALDLSTTDVTDESGLVTVRLPGPDRVTFADYNATVLHNRRDDVRFGGHNYHNVRFTFIGLVAI